MTKRTNMLTFRKYGIDYSGELLQIEAGILPQEYPALFKLKIFEFDDYSITIFSISILHFLISIWIEKNA